jgi:hypothetical protein
MVLPTLSGSTRRSINTRHSLIWSVDWLRVAGGYFAVVDPNDPGSILYLSEVEYKEYWKVASSNRQALTVLARPGDTKPEDRDISATRPPKFPGSTWFRRTSVYSSVARRLWGSLWENGLVVPFDRNIRTFLREWANTLRLWTGFTGHSHLLDQDAIRVTRHLCRVLKHKGPLGLALHLKTAFVAVNQYLAGNPLKSTWDLKHAMRMQAGLPAWLPVQVRVAIRSGSTPTIRVWLSILYVYRSLWATGTPSVRTIGTPGVVWDSTKSILLSEYDWFCRNEFLKGISLPVLGQGWRAHFANPHRTTKSGPNGPAMLSAGADAFWLLETSAGRAHLTRIYYLAASIHRKAVEAIDIVLDLLRETPEYASAKERSQDIQGGRLAFLPEAAGKVRVVAMLDYLSQWILKFYHSYLFRILETIREDCTMDQDKGFKSFLAEVGDRKGTFDSLDISAATDTIPRELYGPVLARLLGPKGHVILDLIARREFRVLSEKEYNTFHPSKSVRGRGARSNDLLPETWRRLSLTTQEVITELVTKGLRIKDGLKGSDAQIAVYPTISSNISRSRKAYKALPKVIRYTRGQPMGAYCSFALLAFAHHALIQFAAYRLGLEPGTWAYRVLGDDSVIFQEGNDRSLAQEYLRLASLFEIPISHPKSYVSRELFVFASRVWFRGVEITPASLRPELEVTSTAKRVAFALDLWNKGWMSDGSRYSNQKWLSRFTHLLLNPLQYFVYTKHLQVGQLGGITSRLFGLLLLPRTSISQVLGQSTDLRVWLAGITGSTEVILDQQLVAAGQFRNRTLSEVYGTLLSRVTRILWHRLAREVLTSAVTNMKNRDYLVRCKSTLLPGRPLVTKNSLTTLLGIQSPNDLMDLVPTRLEELAALLRVEKSYLDKVIPASTRALLPEVYMEFTSQQLECLEALKENPNKSDTYLNPTPRGVAALDGSFMTRYGNKWVTVSEYYEVIIERLLTTLVKYPTPTLLEESLGKRERAEPSRLFTLHQGSLDHLTILVNSISLSLLNASSSSGAGGDRSSQVVKTQK